MNYIKEITKQEKHNYMGELMHLPIIDSGFFEGYSWVTIATSDGTFTGEAIVHPDDYEQNHYTSLTGQLIAHYRALIKFVKYHKRIMIHTYDTLNNIYSTNKKYNKVSDDLKCYLNTAAYNIQLDREIIDYIQFQINKKIEGVNKYYNKGQK